MLKTRTLSCVLAGGLVAGFAGVVAAEETVYVGLSGGQAEVKDFCDGIGSGCDDKATTVRVYAGGFIDTYLAFEGGYRYVDDVTMEASVPGMRAKLEMGYHMFDGSLLLFTPDIGPLRLFAKVGGQFWRQDVSLSLTGFGRANEDEQGFSLRTGVGATMDVTDSISLRVEYDYLQSIGEEVADIENFKSDIHVISAGPEFRF